MRPAPVETGDRARMSLAIWLRQGRAQRGMSVDDVARVTKIQTRILEQLESGHFEGLPADVFVRGFVRSFARCVGLDEGEALTRYVACGRGDASGTTGGAAARAFVETMAELAPVAARAAGAPRRLTGQIEIVAAPIEVPAELPAASDNAMAIEVIDTMAAEIAAMDARDARDARIDEPVLAAEPAPALAVGTSETEIVPAPAEPVIETAIELVEVAPVKKKRTRKPKATGAPAVEGEAPVAAAPAPRKRKRAKATLSPIVSAESATPTQTELPVVVESATGAADGEQQAEAADGERQAEPAAVATQVPAIEVVEAPAVEEVLPPVAPEDLWTPKMPPLPAPTVPWRRPMFAAQPVVPTITIDDSDPDSAERELEDRRETKAGALRSFLPPILLDREDRSARQGGLTLAVIILLIAATLTLSYLMRRPGSAGDGMTARETPVQHIG